MSLTLNTPKITEKQVKCVVICTQELFGKDRKLILKANFGVDSTKELSFEQASLLIDRLSGEVKDDFYIQQLKNKAQEYRRNIF